MELNVNSPAAQRPLFTPADIKRMLLPLLLEQFLSVSMGMADTIMVSSVGEAAISGVSLVDSVNMLVLQILLALSTGGAVVASQYLGKGDYRNAKKGASQLYATMMIATTATALVIMVLCRQLLSAVFGSIEADVMAYAQTYFFISAVSYPFMGIYGAGSALFRAQGDSRTSMYASLVMNVINITGNAMLIFVFHMGVLGAAIATLVGRVFAALYVTWQLQRQGNPMRIDAMRDLLPDMQYIRRILAIGIPSGVENGMFNFGKLILSGLVSTLGTAAIAANAVCNTISSVCNIPGSAVSLAMIPIVGRCLGAGRQEEARRSTMTLMKISYMGLAVTNLLIFVSAPMIAGWFSLSPEASVMAVEIIRLFNLVSIFFWSTSFALPNALRAGGDAKYTMTVSLLSMWLFRVLLSRWCLLDLGMGLISVWLGMYVDWVCRSALFYHRYRGSRWMQHKVV